MVSGFGRGLYPRVGSARARPAAKFQFFEDSQCKVGFCANHNEYDKIK